MKRSFRNPGRSLSLAIGLLTCATIANTAEIIKFIPAAEARSSQQQSAKKDSNISGDGSGTLLAILPGGKPAGQCPLKHTDVKASVSGYVSRVTVKQTFQNTFKDKIEAVYTFPLPENAAVDEMTMRIGDRVIKGNIKKREEARQIYEAARQSGHVASLLDQERPNIFTQSVANIEPGAQVEIEIKYVDLLPYDSGKFTFTFPTVVGPRFMPGTPVGKTGTGRLPDTDVVADASKISPQVAPSGQRAGHDISISLDIDAGVSLSNVHSQLHEIQLTTEGANKAHLNLLNKSTIPNKDFVVSWDVAGDSLKSGYLTHNDGKSGYFTLMLMPPKRVTVENVAPKEMVFLLDCSGSQSGAPLQKAKETMDYVIDHLNPNDTFQIISFSSSLLQFAERPQKVSAATRQRAKEFVRSLQANGGTWMAPAVEKACSIPADEHRLRIVTFMTDGYVGNDFEVTGLVKKLRGKSRWFPFGTGNSVNRFLIDAIAKEGGGEPEYVLLNSSANEVGKKFYDRVSSPVLTDVNVAFDGVEVKEVFPKELSDVWAERPLYIKGRYTKPGAGTVTLTGFAAGKPYKQVLKVNFPEKQSANEVIKPMWARAKVDRLMAEDWQGAQSGSVNGELKEEIVKTALEHHIMTQYTSFVAVEEKQVTKNGKTVTVPVNVEMPDGVSRAATLGEESELNYLAPSTAYGASGGGGMGGPARSFKRRSHSKSAQFYNAPQQLQIVNASPVVRDFRESAGASSGPIGPAAEMSILAPSVPSSKPASSYNGISLPKERSKKEDVATKFDGAITAFLSALSSNPSAAASGVELKKGLISVKVTVKPMSKNVRTQLEAIGFNVKRTDSTTFTGTISVSKLKLLADLAAVTRIEATKI